MTEHLIYGKDIVVQADSFTIEAPLNLTQNTTYPVPITFVSPALVGPPLTVSSGFLRYTPYFRGLFTGITAGFSHAWLNGGITGTLTSGAPTITFPAWLPLGYRPLIQSDISVAGDLGSPLTGNLFVFRFLTNGDVQVYKNMSFDPWLNGDQFRITVQNLIALQVSTV